ncbi:pro-sigmaK processing inhibitor BofA family protein [Frisingicoccus sp.]|uniref:pro-sigmaK processing inhibitor BofA family protein n=1 Tax=Frisingicoccus sp. TaxID=1918627 RepID=UPI002EC2BF94|nr:pro-sigmaK processing inhibitor BofA family protein [Frisingicoccus sp.]
MTQNQLLITIIIISSCFFIGCLIFNQGKMVLTLLGRGILGTLVIGIANTILAELGIWIPVGVNLLNFTVAALLGIPGIAALYGIGLWQIFH